MPVFVDVAQLHVNMVHSSNNTDSGHQKDAILNSELELPGVRPYRKAFDQCVIFHMNLLE